MLKNIGKNFIVGLPGSKLSQEDAKILSDLQPSGIILFKHNIADTRNWQAELKSLIADARTAIGRSKIIISIDHEGGKVHRLKSPTTHFPQARDYAKDASNVGSQMALELSELGFNLNFAPVLDIHSEEENPIIGNRAFGISANEVISSSLAFANALEKNKVLSCGKHFPGHGATKTDSHHELPILDISRDELFKRELEPFKAYIKNGGQLIMTAHILFPEIDPDLPATLSKKVLEGILREELGFKGCVVTDDLEMKALSSYPRKEIGKMALDAGADLLLVANSNDKDILKHALEIASGIESVSELSHKRIDQLLNNV